jgi:hypothetical protein
LASALLYSIVTTKICGPKIEQNQENFMSENNQRESGLFKMLEEALPVYEYQDYSKKHESSSAHNDEELKFEFLVQDMFLDHFFP